MMKGQRRGRRPWWHAGGGRRGWPLFFYGLAFFAVGLVITLVTYAAAAGGGRYLISYGPMVVGLVAMVRGLIDVARSRRAEGVQSGAGYPGTPAAGSGQADGFAQPWQTSAGPAESWQPSAGATQSWQPSAGATQSWQPSAGAAESWQASADVAGSAYGDGGDPRSGYGGAPAFASTGQSAATPAAAHGTLPPANWYADPYDGAKLRWWDGQAWTGHTHPRG